MEKVSLDISREKELSKIVCSFPVIIFILTIFSFFEKIIFILLIWLNQLVPGVCNLYPQYYLILSFSVFLRNFLEKVINIVINS